MLVYADGSTDGTVGGGEMESRVVTASLAALADRQPRRLTYSLVDPGAGDPGVCGGDVELYLEPYMPTTRVFVVGIGHVGRAVIELATWLGYDVLAWDDREEVIEELGGDVTVAPGSITDAVAAHPLDEHTRVVMVTRNVDLDTTILPVLLATPTPTIGLMGSSRRWATTRTKLLDAGVPEADLQRVQSPVGLEIAAETPAEIAVSILAQVIGHERGA